MWYNRWAGAVQSDCGVLSLIYSNYSLYYSNTRKSILLGNLTHGDIENYIDTHGDIENYIDKHGDIENYIDTHGDIENYIDKHGDIENYIDTHGDIENYIDTHGDMRTISIHTEI